MSSVAQIKNAARRLIEQEPPIGVKDEVDWVNWLYHALCDAALTVRENNRMSRKRALPPTQRAIKKPLMAASLHPQPMNITKFGSAGRMQPGSHFSMVSDYKPRADQDDTSSEEDFDEEEEEDDTDTYDEEDEEGDE